jgi:hypothetical protein
MTQQWRSSTSDLLGKRGNACVFEFLRVYQTLRLRVEAEPNSSPTILRHMNGTARVGSKGPRLYEPAFVCSACSHRHGIIGRWSAARSPIQRTWRFT